MEEFDLNFEALFDIEFPQKTPKVSDISDSVLSLKKKIILTDELLGKFSEKLTENEQLRAEKNRILQQLQHYRKELCSYLTTKTDLEKKYEQLEERLFTTQKQLELQINTVAARDSIVKQYQSLTKEKDGAIKKLKDETEALKKNDDKMEIKRLKRKYNVTLKRCNELSEKIEKLQTCSACQQMKSVKQKKKVNENIFDLGSFSPDHGIPASVCSMDTGFESNFSNSESDSDLENLSHKRTPKSSGVVNNEAEPFSKNEKRRGVKNVKKKLRDISASLLLSNKGVECEDNYENKSPENSLLCESLSSTLCANSFKGEKYVQTRIVKYVDSYTETEKDVAEKCVQTRVVQYVDSYTEVYSDAVCKGTQTAEAASVKTCEVLSKGIQTIPVTIQSEQPVLSSTQLLETNSNGVVLCNMQVLKSDAGCQVQEEGKLLLQADVGCQTDVEEGFKEQITDVEEQGQLNCDDLNYTQLLFPLPHLLSPLPPSPAAEDSVSEMDDESMSCSSWLTNEESVSLKDELKNSHVRLKSLSDSTSQTDDLYCMCKQQQKCSHLDPAVQSEDLEGGTNSAGPKNNANQIPFNKYAMKRRDQTLNKTMEESAMKNTSTAGKEVFWKNLIFSAINDDKCDIATKSFIINLLLERNAFSTIEPSVSATSEIHSHLGQIQCQMSEKLQQNSNKWSKLKSSPVKPIVVEMNGKMGSVQSDVFPFYHQQNSSSCDLEEDCDIVVSRKSRKTNRYKSRRRKLPACKKKLESTSSTLSLHEKKNKHVESCSLKRKLPSRSLIQVFNSTSGKFTVTSFPEYDKERELSEHILPTQPHDNLDSCKIEINGHESRDEFHILSNWKNTLQSSETFEIIDSGMSNIISSRNSSISNITSNNCQKTRSLETEAVLTKQNESSYLNNSVEKGLLSESFASNPFSAVTKPGICKDSYNESLPKENVDSSFQNIVNNYNIYEISEHANEKSSRSSSRASFRSCDTIVLSQAENENSNDGSNFPSEETTSDKDENCSPPKIRRLQTFASHCPDLYRSVIKSSARTVDFVSDSIPNNKTSQGKFCSSQHDIQPSDLNPTEQGNENHPLIYNTQVCLTQNNALRDVNKNSQQMIGNKINSNNSSLEKSISLSNENCTREEIADMKNKQGSHHVFENHCQFRDETIKEREIQPALLLQNQLSDIPHTAVDNNDGDRSSSNSDDGDDEINDHVYESNLHSRNTCNVRKGQITQSNATSLQLSEGSSSESESENNGIEVATNTLQSNKITSSCNLQGSCSQTTVSISTKTNISGNISSLTNKNIEMPSNQTLPFRKYCESTIKELVAVKPPAVENEIARKNLIRDTVRNKRLIIPVKAKNIISEVSKKNEVDFPQTSGKEKVMQNQSFGGFDQSSPFCRQGMTGRRKIVLSCSATANLEENIRTENSESNSYSELNKKHQRIAHVPKKDAICNKRMKEESSCDELALPQKNEELSANGSRRSCQRPAVKKTKLQQLKQKCIKQRRLVQSLTLDNNCLTSKPETGCLKRKTSEPKKSEKFENVCVSDYTPTLEDIALDMMLSDSDESINERNEEEQPNKNIMENFSKANSPGKERLNVEESNKPISDMKSQQLACHSQRDSRNLPSRTNDMIVDKNIPVQSTIIEQKYGNKEDVCSNPKFCQKNDTSENFSTENKDLGRKYVKEDVENSFLESPQSPPDLNYESNNYLPLIIPTSPVKTGTCKTVNAIVSSVITYDNALDSEVVKSDRQAHGTLLENSSSSGNENNVKPKWCSSNEQLNCRLKKCQEPNILQEYFEHYKKQKADQKKRNKSQKMELENYSVKKKDMESSFNKYLNREFTDSALTEVVEDCKKIIKEDYKKIIKEDGKKIIKEDGKKIIKEDGKKIIKEDGKKIIKEDYGMIVKNVVKYCEHSSKEKVDFSIDFPMTPTQQRLFALVIKMENDHPTIVDEVLDRISRVVCTTNHNGKRPGIYCLARLFTAFCKMRNYKTRAQLFCYDALYCLKVRAHTVLYAVLTTFPECFPNANSTVANSLTVQAMVYCIFKYGDKAYSDTRNLRNLLSNHYSYKIDNLLPLEDPEYFKTIINPGGAIPDVEPAILLLAKSKYDWSWTYGKLVKRCLLPIVESWKEGYASENAAALCLKLCGYLAKTPPYEKEEASTLMKVFENLLGSESTPSVIKDTCISSLAVLVRMNEEKVFAILKKCKSEKGENSQYMQDVLNLVLKRRKNKWWSRFFKR